MQLDIRKYLGIPFADHGADRSGCDCFGLVQLVYREELGLVLPQLGDIYGSAYARQEVDAAVKAAVCGDWTVDVTGGPYLPWDVLVFRRGRDECHVGLYLWPGTMLHILQGVDSCLERYDGTRWGRMFCRAIRHRERRPA